MLHRSIKKGISLLPQWFMKVITPTLTCLKKKNLHAAIHLANSPCVLSESILKLLQTQVFEPGLQARRNAEAAEHDRSLTQRSSRTEPEQPHGAPRPATPPHEQRGRTGRSAEAPAATPAPGFHRGKHLCSRNPDPARSALRLPSALARSFLLSVLLLAGDTLSGRLCLTVIHSLLKYWVAFRFWHFELSGRKNAPLTTNFEVCFLNVLTVYSLLLFLGHFKLL